MPKAKQFTQRFTGVALVLLSTVVFSFSGVLTKMIESGTWTVACWRGLFGAIIIMAYVMIKDRSNPVSAIAGVGWRGWLLAGVGSVASFAFILAFKLTYVANVAIIYATVPFMAAVLEWRLLGARADRRTLSLALISLFGVGFMVWGGIGAGGNLGNMVAMFMTFSMALYMVLIRAFGEAYAMIAGAISAFQLFIAGLFVINPLAVSASDAGLLVLFGASFAIAVILWTEGTLRIPAAEAGFLGTAETPLAVLFAWLILTELPPAASLVGGAIVLAMVMVYTLGPLLESRRARQ